MRLQLALDVDDLDAAIDFYSTLFDTPPAKIREGYANFAIENPPLKLVLFERAGATGSINHLGVETETAEEVVAAEARLSAAGLATTGIDDTICCFAEKTETWVTAPDGNKWEWYVKNADADQIANTIVEHREGAAAVCCAPDAAADAEVAPAAEPVSVGATDTGGCCG